MLISRLVKVLKKKGKYVSKYIDNNNDKTLWIGSREAIYPLYGMPHLKTNEQILTLLDIPRSEHDKYDLEYITGISSLKLSAALEKAGDPNSIADPLAQLVTRGDASYKAFKTKRGYKFINKIHLDIIDYDETKDDLYYYYYNNMIIVKIGFLPVAIILCSNPVDETMVQEYRELHNLLLEALVDKQREDQVKKREAYEQMSFNDLTDDSEKEESEVTEDEQSK